MIHIHLSAKVKVEIYIKACVQEKRGREENEKLSNWNESDIYSLVSESEIENLPQGVCEGKVGRRGEGRGEGLFQLGPQLLGLRSGNISVYRDQQDEDDHHDHHHHHYLHHDHQDDHLRPLGILNENISVNGNQQDGEGGEENTSGLGCANHLADYLLVIRIIISW